MRSIPQSLLPVWASEIDKHDAYLQYMAIQAISFPNLSGPAPGKVQQHIREGDRMRDEVIDKLVRRMTGGQQSTTKRIRATDLKATLEHYGFSA